MENKCVFGKHLSQLGKGTSALMFCVHSPSSINFSHLAAVMSDLCAPLMLSVDCLKVTCSFPDLLASPAKN